MDIIWINISENYIFRTFSTTSINKKTLFTIYSYSHTLNTLILADCGIRILPEDFFFFLCGLEYVDLRQNFLISLPISLFYHSKIETLLLSGNLFTTIPSVLYTLPKLRFHDLIQCGKTISPRPKTAKVCEIFIPSHSHHNCCSSCQLYS